MLARPGHMPSSSTGQASQPNNPSHNSGRRGRSRQHHHQQQQHTVSNTEGGEAVPGDVVGDVGHKQRDAQRQTRRDEQSPRHRQQQQQSRHDRFRKEVNLRGRGGQFCLILSCVLANPLSRVEHYRRVDDLPWDGPQSRGGPLTRVGALSRVDDLPMDGALPKNGTIV